MIYIFITAFVLAVLVKTDTCDAERMFSRRKKK